MLKDVLDFMGDHPVLTVILAIILMWTVTDLSCSPCVQHNPPSVAAGTEG